MPEIKEIRTNIDCQKLRAKWHDYRDPGFYLITMVCNNRDARPFGVLTGDSEDNATIRLSALGEMLDRCIIDIPNYYPEIEVIEHVVMEDHCHICLQVKAPMQKHLGAVVGMLKNVTTKMYLHEENMRELSLHVLPTNRKRDEDRQHDRIITAMRENDVESYRDIYPSKNEPSPLIDEIGTIIENRVVRGLATKNTAKYDIPVTTISPLWQEGYHDRIVTRYGQIATQKTYIRRNPVRLWLKRHTDRQLTRVRDIQLPLSLTLAQQLKDTAIYWDQRRDVQHSQFSQRHDGAHYSETYVQLVQKFLRKRVGGGDGGTVTNRACLCGGDGGTVTNGGCPCGGDGGTVTNGVEPFLRMRACGDVGLLMNGRPLVRVRISRSVTKEQFIEEVERILGMCEREGAIAISPFRSWSEKALLSALRMNGYDHIIMHGESMWDGWKPQDGSTANHHQQMPEWFDGGNIADKQGRKDDNNGGNTADKQGDMAEVYAGRCLFLALWPDRPRGEKATKADCEVMNEVCRVMEDFCPPSF